ncbi:lipoate--protein ligase [Croceimicrobium hydrocarbonivorans]|uniref:lipoate--protein ligase n=1 Tax=Croceimicrobium hydrocarbonivorans TaxID=2761580 RepID=A0A7H0VGP1_9FLAO|nr:lipoate--protein ligase [Croceimicrobium hydrocarbonivorans]QNR24889.1 lipoate--protein ligase [Croceimicrobium hydrocarbonivorans]
MLCIKHRSTDPFFNIATDEFIFKHLKEDCFMLWQNDNAIIVGKHQNTLAEINLDYVKEHDIKVVRRLSGGGAVYHDMGNLNFTFTRSSERDDDLVDFKRYTAPIIAVLQEMGVNAEFSGRNDIMIEGKKFSGNAEHVFKNKVMHHGTLLFSSNMPNISGALKINPLKYKDRAVKSIPKRVTNIQDHLKEKMSVEEFADRIMNYILENYEDSKLYEFSEEDLAMIESIKKEKYESWDWNYGYSPNYDFKQGVKTSGGLLEMNMNVSKGLIQEVKIQGDFFHIRDITDIEQALANTPHDEAKIREKLAQFNLKDYFKDISIDDLVAAMF